MTALAFVFTPLGRALAAALAILAAVGAFILHERSIGAAKVTAKIETQNKESVNVAATVRKNVQAGCAGSPSAPRCVRDGWTRDH